METSENTIRTFSDDLFTRAEFNEEQVEDTGFSNYSYWRSTIRTFFKSTAVKVCVFLVLLMVVYTILAQLLKVIYIRINKEWV